MAAALLCVGAALTVTSCKEKIDESNLYTFTDEMMSDHFANNPEKFSSYNELLERVHISYKSKSSVKDLLSARGNYTCFAPTNEAVSRHLDSLLKIGETETTVISQIPDSVAEDIVFNSLIENGNSTAYSTATFTEGVLPNSNMNGRLMSISYGVDASNNTVTFVNNNRLIDADIEVNNGFIHVVDRVIMPSKQNIASLIDETPNTKFFGELLRKTGWDIKLGGQFEDKEWAKKNDDIRGTTFKGRFKEWEGMYPEKRNVGFTVFVETDSVFAVNGIDPTGADGYASLKQWVKEHAYYNDNENQNSMNCGCEPTSWDDDYTKPNNWLNQFVAYHILPELLTDKNMVVFANECGNTAGTMQGKFSFQANVWEYWETVGMHRRPMKITGCSIKGVLQRRINRQSIYNMSNYRENSTVMNSDPKLQGIYINLTNGEYNNNGVNGNYYTIDDILIWDERVPTKVLNERMRYDVTSLFPEFMTNNIRQNRDAAVWYFPLDYLDNLVEMDEANTDFIYAPNQGYSSGLGSWCDYQIDEFNIRGNFDFTMKLPPVPYDGTYELRYGVWANDNRGMAQIYMGENPKNLPAIGVPLDLRASSGTQAISTGWVSDATLKDSLDIYENQKAMRNLGFMKGPKYVTVTGGNARDTQNALRKIIFTGDFKAGKTYYIRFKTVLENKDAEFFYDYLELVPKSVYAGVNNEDIW